MVSFGIVGIGTLICVILQLDWDRSRILFDFRGGVWIGGKYVFAQQRTGLSHTSVSRRREIQGDSTQVNFFYFILFIYFVWFKN